MPGQERDIAEWTWPQWAGTLAQFHEAAAIALPKIQAFADFPAPYDAEHPWDPKQEKMPINPRYENYLAAVAVRQVGVVVEERDGYTHHSETLEYLTQIADHAVGEIEKIVVTLGKGYAPPGVELRVSSNGMSVKIAGHERTWTAGLRHELERTLKPRWRLRAPLPFWDLVRDKATSVIVCIGVFVALAAILQDGSRWTEGSRLLVAGASGLLAGLALASIGWASGLGLELLTPGMLPRYQRWRKQVTAGTGAIVLGIVASVLYGLL